MGDPDSKLKNTFESLKFDRYKLRLSIKKLQFNMIFSQIILNCT